MACRAYYVHAVSKTIVAITLAMGFSHALLHQILANGYYSLGIATVIAWLLFLKLEHIKSIYDLTKSWATIAISMAFALLISYNIILFIEHIHKLS